MLMTLMSLAGVSVHQCHLVGTLVIGTLFRQKMPAMCNPRTLAILIALGSGRWHGADISPISC